MFADRLSVGGAQRVLDERVVVHGLDEAGIDLDLVDDHDLRWLHSVGIRNILDVVVQLDALNGRLEGSELGFTSNDQRGLEFTRRDAFAGIFRQRGTFEAFGILFLDERRRDVAGGEPLVIIDR